MQGHYAANQQLIPEENVYSASRGVHLGFVAGVILRERLPAFEKMLWRACRGNVFLRQAEIEDPVKTILQCTYRH
jgi:V-type H+-transporting ATPase subunit a